MRMCWRGATNADGMMVASAKTLGVWISEALDKNRNHYHGEQSRLNALEQNHHLYHGKQSHLNALECDTILTMEVILGKNRQSMRAAKFHEASALKNLGKMCRTGIRHLSPQDLITTILKTKISPSHPRMSLWIPGWTSVRSHVSKSSEWR